MAKCVVYLTIVTLLLLFLLHKNVFIGKYIGTNLKC